MAFYRKKKVNKWFVGAALILFGSYFIIYDLVSIWVPIHYSFLYLTDFWMIVFPILRVALLKLKSLTSTQLITRKYDRVNNNQPYSKVKELQKFREKILAQMNYPPLPRSKQERSNKKIVAMAAIIIITVAFVAGGFYQLTSNCSSTPSGNKKPFYVGVTFSGNTTEEARLLIDRVKNYTNLLVLQSGPISKNETATNEICDYAVEAGLSTVVYFGDLNPRVLTNETIWRIDWVNSAKQRWGERLLGVYYYDEPGGIWLDTDWSKFPNSFAPNSTYDSIAERFIRGLKRDPGVILLKNNSIPVFVSDYALYWFDYLGGYDIVLAQLGWNNTVAQEIGLVRGASNLQEKRWGTIITWKYTESPYLANGEEIYDQMRKSYESGAEYIVLFNYAKNMNSPYGTLQEEHFNTLERFWNEVLQNPTVVNGGVKAEAALVLPRNYGWGMRNPNDIIWGFSNTNSTSEQIWTQLQNKLSEYGSRLDIVYDDPVYPLDGKYSQIFYWNQTR